MEAAKKPNKFLNAGARTGLPDEVLIKIGEITLNWNRAEAVLEELIWRIAGWNLVTGAFVTHDLGNVSRDQLCRNFLHHCVREPRLKSELIDTLAFVAALRTRRNNLVHSVPTLQLATDPINFLEKRSTKLATGEIRITHFLISEIDQLRLDISMATYALAYAHYFVARDLAFTARPNGDGEEKRAPHVWEEHTGLPYIDLIRTRLETIRSQPARPNNAKPLAQTPLA